MTRSKKLENPIDWTGFPKPNRDRHTPSERQIPTATSCCWRNHGHGVLKMGCEGLHESCAAPVQCLLPRPPGPPNHYLWLEALVVASGRSSEVLSSRVAYMSDWLQLNDQQQLFVPLINKCFSERKCNRLSRLGHVSDHVNGTRLLAWPCSCAHGPRGMHPSPCAQALALGTQLKCTTNGCHTMAKSRRHVVDPGPRGRAPHRTSFCVPSSSSCATT